MWAFRNWLNEARDEKKGELLAGKTKNNKMSAISSLFGFSIEKRYRNDSPTRDVKLFPKTENVKKRRRLYTKDELTAVFIKGKPELDWQKISNIDQTGGRGVVRHAFEVHYPRPRCLRLYAAPLDGEDRGWLVHQIEHRAHLAGDLLH